MKGADAVLINAILFSTLFLAYQIKTRGISVGALAIALYAISAIFGIIYYDEPWSSYSKIQLSHYLYYFILFFIICIPIFKFDKIKKLEITYNLKIINKICKFAFYISLIPLIELLFHVPKLLSASVDMAEIVSELHDEKYLGTSSNMFHFSLLGGFFYKFVLLLNEFILLFLFPLIKEKKKVTIEILGVIFVVLVRNLYSFSVASRVSMVWLAITLVLLVIIFSKTFNKTERKKIYSYVFISAGIVVLILGFITLSRQAGYEDKGRLNYTILTFVSRYIGEGMLNFNEYLFDLHTHTNGDYCFYYIKKALFMDPFLMDFDNYQYLQGRLGIPMRVFYTFLGFFVIDIGLTGTFILWSIVSIYIYRKIKINKPIPLSSLLLIFIYMKIIVTGTCIYSYTWLNTGLLLFIFLVYYVFRLNKM